MPLRHCRTATWRNAWRFLGAVPGESLDPAKAKIVPVGFKEGTDGSELTSRVCISGRLAASEAGMLATIF
jgi:hypothetical protein